MTIAKAIEILQLLVKHADSILIPDEVDAISLAISALNLMRGLEEFLHHEH